MVQEHDDEFNLFKLFQTLWNKKYTLLFITFISFLYGIYYTNNLPTKFNLTTPIKHGDQSLFIKYRAINNILMQSDKMLIDEDFDSYLVDSKSIFKKFIIEFQDYDEMAFALRKSKFVNELIKDIKKNDQKDILIPLAKSFKISEIEAGEWEISFTWHNVIEGKYLFNEALLLTLENIKRKLINDVNLLAEAMSEKNRRMALMLNDQIAMIKHSLELQVKKRLQFLKEHHVLAKEMGVEINLLFNHYNLQADFNSLTLEDLQNESNYEDDFFSAYDNNYNNFPYYLRGYKAIEKEIKIIKSRSDEEQLLMSSGYASLKNKLIGLNRDTYSNQLKTIANSITDHNPAKWVNYNFDLADSNSLNSKMYLIASLILGFILGSIFILIYVSISRHKKHT